MLIVWGFSRYRSAGYIQVWNPPFSIFHPIALVLLWFALVALTAAYAPPSRIKSILRHPMLVAVKVWALSHLLVNGDLGSLLLFGSLLAWAIYDRIAVKRRGDQGAPVVSSFGRNDVIVVLIGTVAYAAILWLHEFDHRRRCSLVTTTPAAYQHARCAFASRSRRIRGQYQARSSA